MSLTSKGKNGEKEGKGKEEGYRRKKRKMKGEGWERKRTGKKRERTARPPNSHFWQSHCPCPLAGRHR